MDQDNASQAHCVDLSEHLFSLLEAANAAAWDWDLGADRPAWTAETFDQFGLIPDEGVLSLDEWLERCVHGEDRERVANNHCLAVEGLVQALKVEYRIIHPKHGIRWLATRG